MADSDFSARLSRLERALDVDQRRLGKTDRKQARRAAKEEREERNASVPGGVFALLIAMVIAGYGVIHPDMWWMLFIALGVGSGGARQLAIASRRQGAVSKASSKAAPEVDRAEQLCDELLVELKTSPESVRAFLGHPEQTIESLRAACRQLSERHQAVSAMADEKAVAELEAEKAKLSRNMGDLDPATYQRAVAALKTREELLRQVKASANKIDSEREILLTSLQSLKLRLGLAKTSGQPANIEGVRAEVDRLGEELSALSEALETAQTAGLEPVAPIEGPGGSSPVAGGKERV